MRRTFRDAGRRTGPLGSAALGGLVVVWGLMAAAAEAQEKSLARFVPAEDLALYLQFDGLDAHADAWKATAAAGILNETSTGAMLESLVRQFYDAIPAPGGRPVEGKELVGLLKHLARRGMVLALHGGLADGAPNLTVVFRDAGAPGVRDAFEELVRDAIPEGTRTQILTRQDGRRLTVVRGEAEGSGWVFWFEGNDLAIVTGRDEFGADPVIAALEGKRPDAATNPLVAELARREGGFEPVALGFADASVLPPTPPPLGLGGLKRVDYRWGFEGKALMSVTRVVAPAPRQGLLALLDQPAITAADFPPLPAGLASYTVTSLDLGKSFDAFVAVARAMDPNADEAVKAVSDAFRRQTGVRLREDLLAQVGPKMAFYVQPKAIQASLTPFGALADWLLKLPPVVALVEVRDRDAAGKTLDSLVKVGNALLSQTAGSDGGPVRFEPLKEGRGYRLVVPPQVFPMPTTLQPALVLGERYVALSTTLDGARRAARLEGSADGRLRPDPSLSPDGLVFLSVHDPADLMPELIANLPFLAQMLGRMGPGGPFRPQPEFNPFATLAIDPDLVPDPDAIRARLFPGTITAASTDAGLTIVTRDAIPSLSPSNAAPLAVATLLPAVTAARTAARRSQSTNNLKQIALAMHNFHNVHDQFPAAAICDADGKPLLSWRVAILPYIEQQALYQEFHLDEPWDSPHNKTLIDKLPAVYAPLNTTAPAGHTFYRVFVDGGAMFDPCDGTSLANVTDGTSNTLLCVEAGQSVPWTKPDELVYDPDKPVPPLGGLKWPGGFNAGFADGSVRFLKFTINEEVLRALITRAGGEVVSADAF